MRVVGDQHVVEDGAALDLRASMQPPFNNSLCTGKLVFACACANRGVAGDLLKMEVVSVLSARINAVMVNAFCAHQCSRGDAFTIAINGLRLIVAEVHNNDCCRFICIGCACGSTCNVCLLMSHGLIDKQPQTKRVKPLTSAQHMRSWRACQSSKPTNFRGGSL